MSAGLAGGFDLETNIQWQGEGLAQLTQSSNLTLTPLSLSFDGYELREGELAVDVEGYPQLKADIRFSAAEINVGVPLSDFQTQMLMLAHTESGDVAVSGSHLNLKVLGGEVRAEDYSYALPSGDGQAELQLESIQLPELLALQQQKFESMGVLSGSVPVQLMAGNLSVTNASIGALAPGGYIRYEAEPSVRELAASNAGVAVVLDAMENFEYHTLEASVDYNADGQMFARTSIKGANPDYQGGREVHLNLNLEENILVLLRSLRLGSDIAEQIGEKRGR